MSEDQTAPRRGFQLSVRGMFFVVAGCAVATALLVYTIRLVERSAWGNANFISLENRSGKMLDHVTVRVAGQTVLFSEGLGPKRRHMGTCGAGPIVVDGTFSDGTILHAETPGIPEGVTNTSFRIVIVPGGGVRLER